MSSADYERQKYLAGAEAARRCMAQLREHFDTITLSASYTDASGNEVSLEIEWSDNDDDDEDEAK